MPNSRKSTAAPAIPTKGKPLRLGFWSRLCSVALALAWLPANAPAAAAPQTQVQALVSDLGKTELSLPLLVIDGRLAVAVHIFNPDGAKDSIALEIALHDPCVIALHPNQYAWLNVPTKGAGMTALPVSLSFDNSQRLSFSSEEFAMVDDAGEVTRQNALTANHGAALHEHKLNGKLGLGFLRHYSVELDMQKKLLHLRPSSPLQAEATVTGSLSLPIDITQGCLSLPLRSPTGESRRLILGSARKESLVLSTTPAEALVLETKPPLELSRLMAFRRVDAFPLTPNLAKNTVALLGTEFLSAYSLRVDWEHSRLVLTPRHPLAPEPDQQAYFNAENLGGAEALEQFLGQYPRSEYAVEAAQRLMNLRLAETELPDEALLRALNLLLGASAEGRRTEACLPLLERLNTTLARPDLAILVGKRALEEGRTAEHIQDLYKVHLQLGIAYLDGGNAKDAWRHLMSASFVKIDGDPAHAFLIAFYLGKAYEEQGRLARAYSRYRAALALGGKQWTPPRALEEQARQAIARVQAALPAAQLKELDEL